MNSKIDIKILKVHNAGHFKASPIPTQGSQFENFMGQLNDHFLFEKHSHGSVVPEKGKLYTVQCTADMCWYRARIQNIIQTIAGPQASVLLVDIGQQTLVPFTRIRELPKEFEKIPYHVMDCHLIAVKPLSLVTSYFDLTTTKQVSNNWTEAATKFVLDLIQGCKLEVTIQREDENGKYHVLLHAESPQSQVCVNDELVQQGFAVFSDIVPNEDESPTKVERRRLQQEKFIKQQQEVVNAFKKRANLPHKVEPNDSTSTDEDIPTPIRINKMQADARRLSPLNYLRQQVAEIREPQNTDDHISFIPAGSENRALACRKNNASSTQKEGRHSSDESSGRVRFLAARIPATGSGIPILSREEDSARLKSILKTGKSPSQISSPPSETRSVSPHYPGRIPQHSPFEEQRRADIPNRSPQYPGRIPQHSSFEEQRRGAIPNSSPQYPGRNQPQYPSTFEERREVDIQNTSPQYTGRIPQHSPFEEQRQADIPNQSSQYPGRNQPQNSSEDERRRVDAPNASPQYAGRNQPQNSSGDERRQVDVPNVSPQYPGRNQPQNSSGDERRRVDVPNASSQYTGRNQPQNSSGDERRQVDVPNASPQYTGRIPQHSPFEEQRREDIPNWSPQYLGKNQPQNSSGDERRRVDVPNVSPQYPGRNQPQNSSGDERRQVDVPNVSPQYPGRNQPQNSSGDERRRVDVPNVSPQYPGRNQPQNSSGDERRRVDAPNASSQYPGRIELSPYDERRQVNVSNASPHYPRKDQPQHPIPFEDERGGDIPNSSAQYPGRTQPQNFGNYGEQRQMDACNVSPPYPERITQHNAIGNQRQPYIANASPQYPGRDQPQHSGLYEEGRHADIPNTSHQYPGRDLPQHSGLYEEGRQVDVPNAPPHYPGRDLPQHSGLYEEGRHADIPNTSHQYPGRDLPQHSGLYEERRQVDVPNTSPQYPGRDQPQHLSPFEERRQVDVPNASPQYSGRDQPLCSSDYEERRQVDVPNVSPHYPGRTSNQGSCLPLEALCRGSSLHTEARLPLGALLRSSHQPSEPLPQAASLPTESCLPSEALHQGASVPTKACLPSQALQPVLHVVEQKSSSISQECESESSIEDGVLVHGEAAPRPFQSVENCPLYEKAARLDIQVLTPIQKHMWPALLRGRDVAGIAPRTTGKRLAYLLPIVDQVMESSQYSELPLTNGPLAVILCSNWGNAIDVFSECTKIIGRRRTARVHVIFGGGAEDEQIIPVLNGCEILVATVPCFLRMLTRSYTPLDRLCHIVFDDADVLVEDFTSELKDIMRVYGRLLKSQPGRVAPRQTVVMASSWTLGVASLTRAYLGNPLIIIDDKVEAAIYSGVKQTVELCSTNQRVTKLLGFLDNADRTHEIVVFTNTAQEAETLGEALRSSNHFVLVAHEFLKPHELADIRRQWNTPHTVDLMPILVITDGVLLNGQLATHNATMVIHYDLPLVKNKPKFGRRFFCMARTFTAVKDHRCLSLIFITETSMRQATIAHELVRRTSQLTPPDNKTPLDPNNPQTITTSLLEQMAETAQMVKERDKANFPLCNFLMAYGTCRTFTDKKKCPMRHVVLNEEDYPYDLPTMGVVKVLVLYVMNATCLWVRILEHRNPAGETVTCPDDAKFLQMTIDMGIWYANVSNRKKVDTARVSDMCAIEENGSYYRVKVCDIVRNQLHSGLPLEANVHFVDKGTCEDVKISSLLVLPPQFHTVPFQAVQVFVCRVKPQDKAFEWTPKANNFVKNLVEGKELEGRVVLSLGNTLWLDPLWERKVLKSIKVTTSINNIRVELLRNGLATENKQHLKQLRKLCEDVIDMSIYDGPKSKGDDSSLETVTLLEGDHQEVYMSAVDNPGLFFVQLAASKTKLEELQTKIDEGINSVHYDDDDEISIGSLCVACFTNNDVWYRARVLGIRPDDEYDVFYVDHGDREWIPRARLRPPWPDILTLSLQAIECSLVNIIPLDNDWAPADGDALWDMCEERLLFVKVKSKVASLMSGCHRFVVELVDTSTSIDVVFSEELVAAGHAQASLEGIQTLFPEAAVQLERQDYKYEYEKIPEMCRDILQSRDPSQQLNIAKSLQTVVLNSLNSKDAVRERGGVRSICRLLALTRSSAVQEHLLVSLEGLTFQNDSNCDEARREGGLKSLCHLMEKSNSATVKEHVAWTLKNLAATDKNKVAVRELGGIRILCKELESTTQDKVQEQIAWALEVLSIDNSKNCQAIEQQGGIRTLSHLLSSTTLHFVLERVTRALAALATEPSNRNVIRHDGGLKAICQRIQDSPSEDYLRIACVTLKAVVSNNQHNKEVMKDMGMIHTLQKITSSRSYSSITRRLCSDLLERLIGWAAGWTPIVSPTKTPTVSPTKPPTAPTARTPTHPTPATSTTPIVNGITKTKKPQKFHNSVGSDDDDNLSPLERTDDEGENKNQQFINKTLVNEKVKKQQLLRPLPKRVEREKISDDSDEQENNNKSYHPITVWSQTKDMVRVAVRLRGVKKQTTELIDNQLLFSTKLHGKKYHLEFNLYDTVNVEEKQVEVKGDEVLIVLKKTKRKTWPRLINSKHKLAYLSIDFDRFEISTSSEEENDKKKKPFKYLPPKPLRTRINNKNVMLPEMDISSESSSSEADGEGFDVDNLFDFA